MRMPCVYCVWTCAGGGAQVRDAIASVIEAFGKLTTVVNCAGIAPASRVVGKKGAHPLDLFQRVRA